MRKQLICSVAMAGFAITASQASAETMILATDLPPTHFFSVEGVEPLMACITERTNGDIDFTYMPSGQLVKRNEMADALGKGLASIAFSSLANETANFPLQGVTMLPGLPGGALQKTKAWRTVLDEGGPLSEEIEAQKVKPLLINILSSFQIAAKEKLGSVPDWQGKKIRTTGSALNVLVESIGAVPVQMSAFDIFLAMEQGTVDGTIMGIPSIKPYSVHEAATHISTNASFGQTASMIGMSLDQFNGLPEEQQKIFDECGREAELRLASWLDDSEGELIKELSDHGIEMYQLGDEQLAAFDEKMVPVADDFTSRLEERGLKANDALEQYKAALEN